MSPELIIWIFVIWFAGFLILGQPVATVLIGAGLVGVLLWAGPQVLRGMVGQDVFFTASNYSLSIIPLYLLMAQLLVRGGVIIDLFRVGHRLAGYRRFPLGVATIITGGLLGAVSGSGSASAASLATLASPELERVGYSKRFSVALAAVAGSLSAIIPPSLIIIIYGSITMQPIGHMFIGALIPSVLCITVYILCLWLFAEIRPDAPVGRQAPSAEDLAAHRNSLPAFAFVLALMFVVFGGIYGGVFTVGEAGALGAFTALVGMIAMRRVGLRDIGLALTDAVKVTAMLMMLVIGAQVLARFLSFSRIPRELLALAEPLLDQPLLLLAILMLIIFVAGMILESAAVIVLLIPIILPMLQAAQVDLMWFGVMASFMIAVGLLTPPVGLSTYAAAAAARVPVTAIFRSAAPFAAFSALIVTGLMLVFPGLVTWLPSRIR
jgi:C4-dicarboxylate transporter, DctM subunit